MCSYSTVMASELAQKNYFIEARQKLVIPLLAACMALKLMPQGS